MSTVDTTVAVRGLFVAAASNARALAIAALCAAALVDVSDGNASAANIAAWYAAILPTRDFGEAWLNADADACEAFSAPIAAANCPLVAWLGVTVLACESVDEFPNATFPDTSAARASPVAAPPAF